MSETRLMIGVDTGGTFTDLALWDGGQLVTHKLASTPPEFHVAVLAGCRELCEKAGVLGQPFDLVHSTTVGTNALLERKGAKVGLITTEGFADVLEIGRQNRPELYNFFTRKPAPLVPSELRFEVAERVTASGEVERHLASAEVDGLLDDLEAAGVEGIAVSLLFSFLEERHERLIAEQARARGWHVSVSHEILPEFREYERTSTVVANAYVAPVMQAYLKQLETASGMGPVHIVQSNGGSMTVRDAGDQPVRTLLSGPAAGVIGAMAVGRQSSGGECPRLITFDMGGTSTDVSLLDGGESISTELTLGGLPIRVPMMDIHTVGAGGGSLAWVDAGGALHVGPQSAGADPGPACYGRGTAAAVSDANVVLGRLDPDHFLEGRMRLYPERSVGAFREMAERLGGTVEEVAQDVIRLINANMEQAVRVISVERGFDPREFSLMSFGGAGGLHACAIAEALGCREVLLPVGPGTLCALGCLSANRVLDATRTVMCPLDETHFGAVVGAQHELLDTGRSRLTEESFGIAAQLFEPTLDARYRGQSFELRIPLKTTLTTTLEAFHSAHEQRYGVCDLEGEVEVVTVRVRSIGIQEKPVLPKWSPIRAPQIGERTLHRDGLKAGDRLPGPLRIIERYSTHFILEGMEGVVDEWGNIRIR